MYWDWGNVALAFSVFAGLVIVALNFGFGAVHSRPPGSAEEHRWYEVMSLLTELTRKAAMTEKAEKQLLMVREAAQMMMYNSNIEMNRLKKPDHETEPGDSVRVNGEN
jgi:hypothetical protein